MNNITANRTTFLIGAGTPLDLDLHQENIKPSTDNITKEVCKPYTNYQNLDNPITIVKDIYDKLKGTYPHDYSNPFCRKQPYIHFEHLFHVLEMLYSYEGVWSEKCSNIRMFPVFGPFTKPNVKFEYNTLFSVMDQFILRIMDIVNGYDSNFMDQSNNWYREFYQQFKKNSDFFVLNYDTTIEKSIGDYEDGFEADGLQNAFKRFNPKRLFENQNNLSTINHLHGCINYYFSSYKNINEDIYNYLSHDLYKYKNYEAVNKLMIGRGQGQPTNQSGETYYSSPIVTGLRKTDKLNCVPFDFYHAYLTNCIIQNSRIVISGYSFGDLYCNNLLERIHFLHGEKKRIVLIDFWNISEEDRIHSEYWLSQNLGSFLCRAARCNTFAELMKQLYKNEKMGILYSDNNCLMILPNGFKHAANCTKEIKEFLNI